MNSLAHLDHHELVFRNSESQLMRIRADFSTWAAKRQMFATLCQFAQVRVVVSTNLESLAAISAHNGIYMYLHQYLVDRYDENKDLVFFIIMHEMRHLVQTKSVKDWKHLVSFAPLLDALSSILPRELLDRAGLSDLGNDFSLKHEIFNLAADAAIHEDLAHIFGVEILDQASDFMTAWEKSNHPPGDPAAENISIGPITVDGLEKITRLPLDRNQDWLYYAKHLVSSLASRVRVEPDLARLIVDRQILRRIQLNGLSTSSLDEGALADIDLILGRAEGESKHLIESYEASHQPGPGSVGLDYEEMYQARKELNSIIKKIIDIVKSALMQRPRSARKDQRTYARPHLFIAEGPGRQNRPIETKSPDAVIVLDTSGSMWVPELLEQMAGLTYQLQRRSLIRKAYCCDTKLHNLDLSSGGGVRFVGAGGTAWTVDHHTEILQDVKSNGQITIYYCTDGEVEGLEEASKDERVRLVVINIPQMIHEDLYKKAAL